MNQFSSVSFKTTATPKSCSSSDGGKRQSKGWGVGGHCAELAGAEGMSLKESRFALAPVSNIEPPSEGLCWSGLCCAVR